MASSEKNAYVIKRKDIFLDCLFASTLRGDDSTGLAMIRLGDEKGTPEIYKKALAAPDFLQLGRFNKYMEKFEDYSMVLGHTRAATLAQVKDRNAHPFQDGPITLTHNGHISNSYDFFQYKDWPGGVEVDSHRMCIAMARIGEKEALERAEGPYALAWHNAERGTLNFARNSGRPLKFAYVKGQNTMIYASERLMLRWRLEERGLEIDGKYKEPGIGTWLEFDIKDLRDFKIHRFQSRPRVVGSTAGRTPTTQPPTPSPIVWPEDTPQTRKNTIGLATQTPTSTTTENNIANKLMAYQTLAVEKVLGALKTPDTTFIRNAKLFSQNSGRPAKTKNRTRVDNLLRKYGLQFEQSVIVKVEEFEPYTNQPLTGRAMAHIRNKVYSGTFQNIKFSDYNAMKAMPSVLCRIVGATMDKDKKQLKLLFERHPLYKEFVAQEAKMRPQSAAKEEDKSTEQPDTVVPIPRGFSGPSGRNVSLDRFNELAKHGCANCQGDIDPKDHKTVTWVGDSPLCFGCGDMQSQLACKPILN